MKYCKFNLYLLLALTTFGIHAMNPDDENSEETQPSSQSSHPVFGVVILGSSSDMPQLWANLSRLNIIDTPPLEERTRLALEAAENCDLEGLQRHVDHTNANILSPAGYSLLSLPFTKESSLKSSKFTPVADYLLSQGALMDRRVNSFEKHCPLATACGAALFNNKFSPFEYFLAKNGNPFLPDQSSETGSTALMAVTSIDHLTPQQLANRLRILAMFAARAKNLHEALETFDIPTITKFATPETVNALNSQGTAPLLNVASIYCPELKEDHRTILQLLLAQRALPNQISLIRNTKTTLKAVPLQSITTNAIASCDTSLIPLFLEHGADPKLDPENISHAPYDIAKFHQTLPSLCSCYNNDCPVRIENNNIRNTATAALALFDAHLAKTKQ